jgi:tetratricopeptide (TPR) repeat protein
VRTIAVNPVLPQSEDITATYNLLFRYLFDAHRDLPLPVAFLIDGEGQIVKVYTGRIPFDQVRTDVGNIPKTSAERLAKALPFRGVEATYEYGRNYLSLGSIFYQRGYIEAAAGFFESARKSNPSSAEAYYGLGSVWLKQNKDDRAKECFEKAVKLKAAYPETEPNAWNNLGLLATREGNTEGAIDCFQKALQFDPEHLVTLQNLGNAYRQQKRWDNARTTLERAVAIKPDSPEANYSLAMVYAQQDDSARAYELLQKALQEKPNYPEALNNLGILYLRTQRPREAVSTFEQCIRVAPLFDQSYLNLARVYAIEGDREKARGILNALLGHHPDHVLAKQALAQLSQ